jgi:hypothetical protein
LLRSAETEQERHTIRTVPLPTSLTHALVSDYLAHHGYLDTLCAFESAAGVDRHDVDIDIDTDVNEEPFPRGNDVVEQVGVRTVPAHVPREPTSGDPDPDLDLSHPRPTTCNTTTAALTTTSTSTTSSTMTTTLPSASHHTQLRSALLRACLPPRARLRRLILGGKSDAAIRAVEEYVGMGTLKKETHEDNDDGGGGGAGDCGWIPWTPSDDLHVAWVTARLEGEDERHLAEIYSDGEEEEEEEEEGEGEGEEEEVEVEAKEKEEAAVAAVAGEHEGQGEGDEGEAEKTGLGQDHEAPVDVEMKTSTATETWRPTRTKRTPQDDHRPIGFVQLGREIEAHRGRVTTTTTAGRTRE